MSAGSGCPVFTQMLRPTPNVLYQSDYNVHLCSTTVTYHLNFTQKKGQSSAASLTTVHFLFLIKQLLSNSQILTQPTI